MHRGNRAVTKVNAIGIQDLFLPSHLHATWGNTDVTHDVIFLCSLSLVVLNCL